MGIPLSTRFNPTLEKDDDELYGVAQAVLDDIDSAASAAATANSNASTAQSTATAAGSAASAAQSTADAAVPKSLYDANSILTADTDNTPAALVIAASRLVGRKATGGIAPLTAAEALAVLGVDLSALVGKSLFDANTILAADTDDTPAALAVAASRIVGRKATGGIAALTAAEALTVLGIDLTSLVSKSLFDANTILAADTDDTPAALAVAASRVVGRKATGGIAALNGMDLAALIDSMTGFAWSSNAATLDLSTGKNFQATNALAGNSALTLSNGVDGSNGVVIVVQDSTPGRTMSVTASGRTIKKDLNTPDTSPLSTANSHTMFQYLFYTAAGTACFVWNRIFLQ